MGRRIVRAVAAAACLGALTGIMSVSGAASRAAVTPAAAATPAAVAATPAAGPSGPAAPHNAFGSDWPVYHHDTGGSGADPNGTNLSPATALWSSAALDGALYGEPLVEAGRVFVATENDTVYALAADTGAVLWSTHVGTPVPSGALPCGNISPVVGITGTPVIDPARAELFAVADEWNGTTNSFHVVGLDLYGGTVLLDQVVSLPGTNLLAQLQRPGLTLAGGSVIAGFGGNDGDCGTYHGWAVSVPEGGGTQRTFEVDAAAGQLRGAIWMGGAAPVVDASGNVWLATGNGSNTSSADPYDDSDGVMELTPGMVLERFFAPSTWYSDNAADADLGSASPALLSNGTVFQAGKSQHAYLLSQASPGGIGGQLTSVSSFCGANVDGGSAVSGTTVYVPCQAGIEAVRTASSPASLSVSWQTTSGATTPPILAGGLVWSMSSGGALYGLDPSTGAAVQHLSVGSPATHFPTPAVADGLLLASSATQVHAFAGPAGAPPAPDPAPTTGGYQLVASDGGVFAFSAPYDGSMGGRPLAAPIVGMAGDPVTGGYWLVASDGGVFAFGAPYDGSMGGQPLAAPIVGMARDPVTGGYWLAASDGGVFAFGAPFEGSMGGRPLAAPIVGMAATASGGYWLVASDGGLFAFGAPYHGSMGGQPLARPIVGMAGSATGGYWLVASDGGVFAFGAPYDGSMGGRPLAAPVVGMAEDPSTGGYWLVGSDGGIFTFDAAFHGSMGGRPLAAPIVGMAAGP